MVAESFVLAAAQVEPVFHDKEGTLEQTCQWIKKAGNQGVDLLVFPETYFPGYPSWTNTADRQQWSDLMVDLQKNSLHVEDDAIDIIGEAAAEADLNVVLGANERSDRPGSETLYNSLFYFDRTGSLLGRHRKLMPTHRERTVWGRGDPSSLRTYDTDLGTLGGLICYENHMTLSKAALCGMGEEIHAAAWPGFWEATGSSNGSVRAESSDAIERCNIYPAMREYAFETQSFVVSCSMYLSEETIEEFGQDELSSNKAAGGSMLIGPNGLVKDGPVFDEEALVTTKFHRDERRTAKAYFDAMGHYTRWDAASLEVNDATYNPITQTDKSGTSSPGSASPKTTHSDNEQSATRPSPAAIEEFAEEYSIPIEAAEDFADDILDDPLR